MTSKIFNQLPFFLLFIILFFSSLPIVGETVILRTHEVLHGRIVFQDSKILKLKEENGSINEYPKNTILKVSYREVKDEIEIKKIIQEAESKLAPEERKKVVTVDKRNRYSVVWRSSLLPGWGQWYSGKKTYATLSIVAMLGAAGYAYQKREAAITEKKSYEALTRPLGFATLLSLGTTNSASPFDSPFDFGLTGPGALLGPIILGQVFFSPYQQSVNSYNFSLQILSIAYGVQLIHSYFIGREWENADPNTTIGKKAAYGEWKLNASPRQTFTQSGLNKETYYELNYIFQF